MRLAPGLSLRSLGPDHLVFFPPGGDGRRRAVRLNASAAFLWEAVRGRDFEPSDLAALLEQEYGLEPEAASADASAIASAWLSAGLAV